MPEKVGIGEVSYAGEMLVVGINMLRTPSQLLEKQRLASVSSVAGRVALTEPLDAIAS